MRRITSPKFLVLFSLLVILHSTISAFAGIRFTPGQGVVLTGADGVVLTGADGVVLTGADGVVLTGADGVVLTGADGVVLTGADSLTYTGVDELIPADPDPAGIRSFDLELALLLDRLPDSSAINVFIIFYRMPTEADLASLRTIGVLGGTRFRNLPIILVNATKGQIAAISTLPSVRSIYSNKTFEFFTNNTRAITGQSRVITDPALTQRNGGVPISGRGVTVAVLDTGIDATHPDLAYGTQVVQNVRVVDMQGAPPTFVYPQVIEGLSNTDAVMGHGTFVAGVIAGTGVSSGGYYGGMAPGAKLLGVSCGDASLFYVLSGIDYILSNRESQNIRAVNCSFGISGVFDRDDPVNIATKILHDAGVSVLFSAGNRGDQPNSLNPYSVAPWVIGVGSTTKQGTLSSFSSRGAAGYGHYHPTLVAPGEAIVSTRAVGINVVATAGLASVLNSPENDLRSIPPAYLARYTMSSGTSFAAPHVAGTIAMMLQANPQLTPRQIKRILQETATPMLGYSRYEVGAGHLNAYAAVRRAAFGNPFGQFRSGFNNQRVSLSREPIGQFRGEVSPGGTYTTTLDIPSDAIYAMAQVGWTKNRLSINDLCLTLTRAGESIQSKPTLTLAGQDFQKTGVVINNPASGAWNVTVNNTSDITSGSVQQFVGTVEIIRANYGGILDLGGVSPAQAQAVKRALFTGLMTAESGYFRADSPATRAEVARAVMLGAGARVSQYLPYEASFVDVPAGDPNAIFVESTTHSPLGNLMGASGAYFNPQVSADRLTVARALAKALDIAQTGEPVNPGISDWNAIPGPARADVALVVSRNLMRLDGAGYFRPYESITRADLASAAIVLQQATR